ncbi:hypothetical protein SRABI76_00912 [Microbacterium oxydans]|uniref:hypothetical protein n=1 Tax=Microbacterium oxydans TaxID=82380 RepID=UPI001D38CAC7|nr:hypothetical protein [Microbacterium oxydans]CAH0155970.1 hypothetical protein SRABI76_00912 [Microbacterium oxydans]
MRRSRRLLAGVVGLAVLVGVAALPSVQMTEARFTDSEYSTASFTASTLETPVITSCTVTSFLGSFTGLTITWTSPYLKVQERLSINAVAVDNANVTQTGSGPYTYSATISSTLLNTLLGSLLGSSNTVRVESIYAGTSWASPAATKTLSVGGLLGLGGNNTCT